MDDMRKDTLSPQNVTSTICTAKRPRVYDMRRKTSTRVRFAVRTFCGVTRLFYLCFGSNTHLFHFNECKFFIKYGGWLTPCCIFAICLKMRKCDNTKGRHRLKAEKHVRIVNYLSRIIRNTALLHAFQNLWFLPISHPKLTLLKMTLKCYTTKMSY
jgi:hypothetical protein